MAKQHMVYSAAATSVVFGGHAIAGFGEGEDVITVERNNPAIEMNVGMQGDSIISQSTDKSGRIVIRLLAGSTSNNYLSAKANAADAGAVFTAPLIITETGSEGKVTATKCVIEGIPSLGRGATAKEVEWVFLSGDISINHAATGEL